ncbi:hypothetical protein [Pontibacillus salipaludis]|uniref:Uncharacterized protein n=1 Tax=Pontibacillus salipaludis TaxID=1697394 RepID=A0ABQ1QBN0_9BACI|nr:hypothetical protein [Pontibacillus salipaludis]GGD20643.1 hypothetical protein GCM10011389_30410 [Pontibacillus salipaludis]
MSKRPLMVLIVLVLISIAAWVVWYFYPTPVQQALCETQFTQLVKERTAEAYVEHMVNSNEQTNI